MFIMLINVQNFTCIDSTVHFFSLIFLPQRRLGSTQQGFVTNTMYKRNKLLSVHNGIFSSVLFTTVFGSKKIMLPYYYRSLLYHHHLTKVAFKMFGKTRHHFDLATNEVFQFQII